jgi:hypothetical protein
MCLVNGAGSTASGANDKYRYAILLSINIKVMFRRGVIPGYSTEALAKNKKGSVLGSIER